MQGLSLHTIFKHTCSFSRHQKHDKCSVRCLHYSCKHNKSCTLLVPAYHVSWPNPNISQQSRSAVDYSHNSEQGLTYQSTSRHWINDIAACGTISTYTLPHPHSINCTQQIVLTRAAVMLLKSHIIPSTGQNKHAGHSKAHTQSTTHLQQPFYGQQHGNPKTYLYFEHKKQKTELLLRLFKGDVFLFEKCFSSTCFNREISSKFYFSVHHVLG